MEKNLIKVSPGGLTYFAEYKSGRHEQKMDHLGCFAGMYIIMYLYQGIRRPFKLSY